LLNQLEQDVHNNGILQYITEQFR